MNELDLKHIIEATLLAAGRPVTTQQLLDLFDERERPTPEQLQAAFAQLAADYADRGIEVVEVASGWRVQVRQRHGEIVSRLWQERPSKYSRALLETLALIAYRQPITRSEIEEIRGVSISSTIMRTLHERNWIRTVGHREVPGRPELLGTTREFLDYFGLKSLDQLPTLAELKDIETIGVQLELPAGAAPAEGDAAAASAAGQSDAGLEAQPEAAAADAPAADADGDTLAAAAVADESSGAVPVPQGEAAAMPLRVAEMQATVAGTAEADGVAAQVLAQITDLQSAGSERLQSAAEPPVGDAEDSDDDQDDDDAAAPVLVASREDDGEDQRVLGEPPAEV